MVKVIDKGNGLADVYFGTTAPMKVFEEYEDLVVKEYGNCRWLALKGLMDSRKISTNLDSVYAQLDMQDKRIAALENYIEHLQSSQEVNTGLGSLGK